jgi:hypothetical protein
MSARQQYGYTPTGSVEKHMAANSYRDYRANAFTPTQTNK